jgi:hypothetical protein
MYTAKVAVGFEILKKTLNISEHHVEFLNVKPCGKQRDR